MNRKFLAVALWVASASGFVQAADMSVQLTTTDGSTKLSIQNSSAVEVSSITSLGDGYFRNLSGQSIQINNTVVISTAGHFIGGGGTPTINTTASVGSVVSAITGTDSAGEITLTPGVIAAGGVVSTITFNTPYATAPYVVITPANSNAASALTLAIPLLVYVTRSPTSFTISSVGVATFLASTVYKWDYHVIQ